MKKTVYLLILVAFLLTAASCGWLTRTGPLEGMEIYVTADSPESRSLEGRGVIPVSVQIGFTKVWFPTVETFAALKAANPDHDMGQIFVNETTVFSGFDFYKALDSSADNPYVFNTATSEPFTPSTNPSYGAMYHGVFLETVYFQMDMPTYSIRWYQKDSDDYKAQDVLVDTGDGWKFAYLKRTTEFDFSYNDQTQEHTVFNESATADLELVTQDNRLTATQYYESWLHNSCAKSDNYVNMALDSYPHPTSTSNKLYHFFITKALDEGTQLGDVWTLTDQTLVQYFRLTNDVPNDAGGDHSKIGVNQVDGYWNENGGLLMQAELLAGYDDDAYDNPKVIEIFTEDENEAKMYKIEISFAKDNPDAFACGLGISSLPNSLEADSTWSQIVSHVAAKNFVSLSPITGGKEIAFGWLDFNDEWQGEFSPDAGE